MKSFNTARCIGLDSNTTDRFAKFTAGKSIYWLFFTAFFILPSIIHAQTDCCGSGKGDKVKQLTLWYTGENCNASSNNQGAKGSKWDCTGDAAFDAQVYIIVNNSTTASTSGAYFAGNVNLDGTFVATAATEMGADSYVHIFNQQGGTRIQFIKIHTSCSVPVVLGDQFGSIIIVDAKFKNGFSCTTPLNCPICVDNRLTNGGFNINTTGWTSLNGAFSVNNYLPQCGTANHGQIERNVNTGTTQVYQDVSGLTGGSTVQLTFWAGVHNAQYDTQFGMEFYNGSSTTAISQSKLQIDKILGGSPGMQFYTINVTLPSTATRIRVIGTTTGLNSNNWLKFDEVCLKVNNPCDVFSPTITGTNSICNDNLVPTNLSVTGGIGTYLWSTGATTSSVDVTPSVNGSTYTVTVTSVDNCVKVLTKTILVKPCSGQICFNGANGVGATANWTITYTQDPVNDKVKIRATLSKNFVDNTYGTNAIGWGTKGHTFGNLTGSDHLILTMLDGNNSPRLITKLDYITASNTAPSGYDALGVTGGEGQMIQGSSSDVLSSTTSLDQNLNSNGSSYYNVIVNSPATNANYTPNPTYPNWIFDVWYEVEVRLSAFGAAGFGKVGITGVHASPSKTGNNTEEVTEGPCCELDVKIVGDSLLCSGETTTLSVATTKSLVINATEDVEIWNATDGLTKNYGSCDKLYLNGTPKQRSLLKFNISSIPANAEIVSAKLNMSKIGGSSDGYIINAHRITNSWTEGSGSCDGTTGTANYNQRSAGINWSTAGGDFNPSPEAATNVSVTGRYDWSVGDMVAGWRSGAFPNHGILLKFNNESLNKEINFASSENATAGNRPTLTVNYFDNSPPVAGTVTYKWSTGATTATINVNPGTTTTYTVTVTETSGCTGIKEIDVTVNPRPTVDAGVNSTICQGQSIILSASATGGTSPYTYAWSDGLTNGVSRTPTATKTYTVTVTDNKGCTSTDVVIVSIGANVNLVTTGATICKGASGQITAVATGGTQPYIYTWSDNLGTGSSKTVSPVSTKTYTVTVEDGNGCTKSATATVTVKPAPTVDIGPDITICTLDEEVIQSTVTNITQCGMNGESDCDHILQGTTGWIESASSAAKCGDNAGAKLWTRSGDGTSSLTLDFGKNVPIGTTVCVRMKLEHCSNTSSSNSDVKIQRSTSATTGYTDIVTSKTFTNTSYVEFCYTLTADTRYIKVVDNGKCAFRVDYVKYATPDTYNNSVQYSWSGPGIVGSKTGPSVVVNQSGTYTLVVTDCGGCTASDQVVVINNGNVEANAGADKILCKGGSILLTATPVAGATYEWRSEANNQVISTSQSVTVSPIVTTSYVLKVTKNGCEDSDDVIVAVNPRPTVTAIARPDTICINESSTLTAAGSGGTSPYTYAWSNGLGTGASKTVSPTTTTIYVVTVTDSKGCTASTSVTVTIEPKAKVGDFVWEDKNANGVQENGEPGINGIQVILYNALNNMVASTTTINNPVGGAPGYYQFEVCKGSYYIVFGDKTDFVRSPKDAAADGIDSDASQTTGRTDNFTLNPGDNNQTIDAGYYPSINLELDKTFISAVQQANGSFDVTYNIQVKNTGGAGTYDLTDNQGFDEDAIINNALYTSNAPGNAGPTGLAGIATWNLATNQAIAALATHTYTLLVNVKLNLTDNIGDNVYQRCDVERPRSGRGLYNKAEVYVSNVLKDDDDACGDIPYITHDKKGPVISVRQPNGNYNVTYTVEVTNEGGAEGRYDLKDIPNFDDDITIISASYSSVTPPNVNVPLSIINGVSNTLANDVLISAGVKHTYTLTYVVKLDLRPGTSGDNSYTSCTNNAQNGPSPGQGLYNMTTLDTNNDGTPEETDEVCGDLPEITMVKDFVSVVKTEGESDEYEVTYKITVRNIGGATGNYSLLDLPLFDDDIQIISGSVSGQVNKPMSIIGSTTLADKLPIDAGAMHMYNVLFTVLLDLGPNSLGDKIYTPCSVQDSTIRKALNNVAKLDKTGDNSPDIIDYACGDLPKSSLGDFVWEDKNANGIQDAGEPGISDVPIELFNASGGPRIRSTTTDPNGFYEFTNLEPGNYIIRFEKPQSYIFSLQDRGVDDKKDSDADTNSGLTDVISLSPGERDTTIDAGLYRLGSIGDLVWEDENADGIKDVAEFGINNVKVNLNGTDGLGNVINASTTTNPAGAYLFANLVPGNYTVTFVRPTALPPFSYKSSPANTPADDARDSDANAVTGAAPLEQLESGENNMTIDAGFYRCSYVGDYVWIDQGPQKDAQDSGDIGINGVRVELYSLDNPGVPVAITTTANNPADPTKKGYYLFEVCKTGMYVIKVLKPQDLMFITPNVPMDKNLDSDVIDFDNQKTLEFTVGYAMTITDIDAGLKPKVLPVTLKEFTGNWNQSRDINELTWITLSEVNNDYFEIERSVNGSDFVVIAKVKGKGNSSVTNVYNLDDSEISWNGEYTYRLRQRDFDGKVTVFDPIKIRVERKGSLKTIIYPNPTVSHINIEVTAPEGSKVNVDIYDNNGKLILKSVLEGISEGKELSSVIEAGRLSKGVYHVMVNVDGTISSNKLIVIE